VQNRRALTYSRAALSRCSTVWRPRTDFLGFFVLCFCLCFVGFLEEGPAFGPIRIPKFFAIDGGVSAGVGRLYTHAPSCRHSDSREQGSSDSSLHPPQDARIDSFTSPR